MGQHSKKGEEHDISGDLTDGRDWFEPVTPADGEALPQPPKKD